MLMKGLANRKIKIKKTAEICVCVRARCVYPAAAPASLLLLLLLDELHGRSWRRRRSHGSHHIDAVLRERGQAEALPGTHVHLLELLESPQRELEGAKAQMKQAIQVWIRCRRAQPIRVGLSRKIPIKYFKVNRKCRLILPTRTVFQSRSSTFFMGKWGAFMLQNLVTMVKRSRVNGSPL